MPRSRLHVTALLVLLVSSCAFRYHRNLGDPATADGPALRLERLEVETGSCSSTFERGAEVYLRHALRAAGFRIALPEDGTATVLRARLLVRPSDPLVEAPGEVSLVLEGNDPARPSNVAPRSSLWIFRHDARGADEKLLRVLLSCTAEFRRAFEEDRVAASPRAGAR